MKAGSAPFLYPRWIWWKMAQKWARPCPVFHEWPRKWVRAYCRKAYIRRRHLLANGPRRNVPNGTQVGRAAPSSLAFLGVTHQTELAYNGWPWP